jgi:hypothetical protein
MGIYCRVAQSPGPLNAQRQSDSANNSVSNTSAVKIPCIFGLAFSHLPKGSEVVSKPQISFKDPACQRDFASDLFQSKCSAQAQAVRESAIPPQAGALDGVLKLLLATALLI